MRVVEVITHAERTETISELARRHGATDIWWSSENEDGRRSCRMLVSDDARQELVDALQSLVTFYSNSRILILPVDASLPREEDKEKKDKKEKTADEAKRRKELAATREEIYDDMRKGTILDTNYWLLTILSTIVAAIGLIENNVAVVIGAMVIAPLLGPIIAFSLATSLGDTELTIKSFKTGLIGLILAIGLSILIGLFWPESLTSREILDRTYVGMDSVALALASGAAAVLSLTTGLSTTLVGVMVAVALLPPTAVMGMLIGAQQYSLSLGAGLLLAVNIVCVLLAAKIVFLFKGIKPRTWHEKSLAKKSTLIYMLLWTVLLILLIALILLRNSLQTASF